MKLAGNAAMGVAMGLLFVLVLNFLDQSGVVSLVDHSYDKRTTALVFVGTIVTTFGIGATLTGLVFVMTDEPK
jgi:quinol-cytochrome oxidoreductase complex cytochrome b subunit